MKRLWRDNFTAWIVGFAIGGGLMTVITMSIMLSVIRCN